MAYNFSVYIYIYTLYIIYIYNFNTVYLYVRICRVICCSADPVRTNPAPPRKMHCACSTMLGSLCTLCSWPEEPKTSWIKLLSFNAGSFARTDSSQKSSISPNKCSGGLGCFKISPRAWLFHSMAYLWVMWGALSRGMPSSWQKRIPQHHQTSCWGLNARENWCSWFDPSICFTPVIQWFLVGIVHFIIIIITFTFTVTMASLWEWLSKTSQNRRHLLRSNSWGELDRVHARLLQTPSCKCGKHPGKHRRAIETTSASPFEDSTLTWHCGHRAYQIHLTYLLMMLMSWVHGATCWRFWWCPCSTPATSRARGRLSLARLARLPLAFRNLGHGVLSGAAT